MKNMRDCIQVNAIAGLSKKTLWLAALFPLLFVADILYGAMEFYSIPMMITPGTILRGALLLIAIYKILEHRNTEHHQLQIWLALLVLFVIPGFVVGVFYGQNIFFELQSLFKVLYLPLITGLLISLTSQHKIKQDDILRFIEYAAYVLGLALMFSVYLGIQPQTYDAPSYGTKGIFFAANDLSLVFGLTILAAAYRLVLVNFSLPRLLLFGNSVVACTLIGTRASLVVIAIAALVTLVSVTLAKTTVDGKPIINHLKKWVLGFMLFIAMGGALVNGLQNHLNFESQRERLANPVNPERSELLGSAFAHIGNRPPIFMLTGEGMDAFHRGVALYFPKDMETRRVEVDWMDIFGAYGIGFTVLICAFVLWPLLISGFRFIVHRHAIYGLIGAGSLLYLGYASIIGHAFIGPMPSTIMAGYLTLFFIQTNIQQSQ